LYKKEIEWWGNEIPGLHNILGNVLNPYILSMFERENKQSNHKEDNSSGNAKEQESSTKPSISNPRLKQIMDELYRPGCKIGSGSLADIIRYELNGKQPTKDKFRYQNEDSKIRKDVIIIVRPQNQQILKRIFVLLDEMALSNDTDVVNVLNVTVLERLGDDPNILKEAFKYMSPKLQNMSDEMEEYLGRK